MTTGVPAGYHSITPAIIVHDGVAAIEFYRNAFGATERSRMMSPDGKLAHAELQIGDSILMLGEASAEWGLASPLEQKGVTGSLHIYVPDVDAVFERALQAGARVRQPLENAFWGDRYGKVVDPFGHEWGLATRVRDMSDADVEAAGQDWMKQNAAQAKQPA